MHFTYTYAFYIIPVYYEVLIILHVRNEKTVT